MTADIIHGPGVVMINGTAAIEAQGDEEEAGQVSEGRWILYAPACVFTVEREPVPCARPRSRIVTPRGREPFIQTYPDPKSAEYQELVGENALWNRPPGWRIDWARYEVRVRVYQRERRGDGDNFLKQVADGCQGILWDNDRRIRRWTIDIIDELQNPRLEVLATMVGDLDAAADKQARAKLLVACRKGKK
jgi:Holliday junction resolvase RusA-like endonuclease